MRNAEHDLARHVRQEREDVLVGGILLGRPPSAPDEIGKAAAFLASDDGSYVAGAELFAGGGVDQIRSARRRRRSPSDGRGADRLAAADVPVLGRRKPLVTESGRIFHRLWKAFGGSA